jgi:CHAT domain-containing protein
MLQGMDPADGAGIEALAAARSRKERAEQELARHSAEQRRRVASREVGLASVRAALPPGSALVSFVEFERVAGASGDVERGSAADTPGRHCAAFVLKNAEGSASFISLGPADDIDTLVARWQESAGENPQLDREGRDAAETRYRRAGTELRKKIWDPLTRALAGSRFVFVVPDGALHLVNLATLPVSDERYLIETGPLVHYLSAERDLALQTRKQYARAGALILGGPNADAEPSGSPPVMELAQSGISATQGARRSQPAGCESFRSMRFEPLSGAMSEAAEVGALLKDTTGVVELTGSAATESSFKRLAPGQRLIHLATHGFFLQDQCASAVHGSGDTPAPTRGPGQAVRPITGDNPLLLSGLILAGANRRSEAMVAAGGEDGVLTAEEVGSLDLSGVEWAVLSACETGIGKVRAGEGILGLRRAFEVAGAGTLITSLWRVEDEATRVWMKNLYRARLSGKSTIEAVSDASLSMLQQSRSKNRTTHPFYWGGFVAAGDWR